MTLERQSDTMADTSPLTLGTIKEESRSRLLTSAIFTLTLSILGR